MRPDCLRDLVIVHVLRQLERETRVVGHLLITERYVNAIVELPVKQNIHFTISSEHHINVTNRTSHQC